MWFLSQVKHYIGSQETLPKLSRPKDIPKTPWHRIAENVIPNARCQEDCAGIPKQGPPLPFDYQHSSDHEDSNIRDSTMRAQHFGNAAHWTRSSAGKAEQFEQPQEYSGHAEDCRCRFCCSDQAKHHDPSPTTFRPNQKYFQSRPNQAQTKSAAVCGSSDQPGSDKSCNCDLYLPRRASPTQTATVSDHKMTQTRSNVSFNSEVKQYPCPGYRSCLKNRSESAPTSNEASSEAIALRTTPSCGYTADISVPTGTCRGLQLEIEKIESDSGRTTCYGVTQIQAGPAQSPGRSTSECRSDCECEWKKQLQRRGLDPEANASKTCKCSCECPNTNRAQFPAGFSCGCECHCGNSSTASCTSRRSLKQSLYESESQMRLELTKSIDPEAVERIPSRHLRCFLDDPPPYSPVPLDEGLCCPLDFAERCGWTENRCRTQARKRPRSRPSPAASNSSTFKRQRSIEGPANTNPKLGRLVKGSGAGQKFVPDSCGCPSPKARFRKQGSEPARPSANPCFSQEGQGLQRRQGRTARGTEFGRKGSPCNCSGSERKEVGRSSRFAPTSGKPAANRQQNGVEARPRQSRSRNLRGQQRSPWSTDTSKRNVSASAQAAANKPPCACWEVDLPTRTPPPKYQARQENPWSTKPNITATSTTNDPSCVCWNEEPSTLNHGRTAAKDQARNWTTHTTLTAVPPQLPPSPVQWRPQKGVASSPPTRWKITASQPPSYEASRNRPIPDYCETAVDDPSCTCLQSTESGMEDAAEPESNEFEVRANFTTTKRKAEKTPCICTEETTDTKNVRRITVKISRPSVDGDDEDDPNAKLDPKKPVMTRSRIRIRTKRAKSGCECSAEDQAKEGSPDYRVEVRTCPESSSAEDQAKDGYRAEVCACPEPEQKPTPSYVVYVTDDIVPKNYYSYDHLLTARRVEMPGSAARCPTRKKANRDGGANRAPCDCSEGCRNRLQIIERLEKIRNRLAEACDSSYVNGWCKEDNQIAM